MIYCEVMIALQITVANTDHEGKYAYLVTVIVLMKGKGYMNNQRTQIIQDQETIVTVKYRN